ncbi:hypothetical protein CCACVL1_19490 [Corchorus capsularis]|uniref:Uncharacterized protein n=1 Tax=Corchorus capsularis TaxID=210143 RepID=A0A1R3HGU7_COCAP|nr:hypothetical protein CCACVL1_19490 [Corchorus capsularis]
MLQRQEEHATKQPAAAAAAAPRYRNRVGATKQLAATATATCAGRPTFQEYSSYGGISKRDNHITYIVNNDVVDETFLHGATAVQ